MEPYIISLELSEISKLTLGNNGVIQTYKAYPDGKFASAGRNFNGTVCAEFIGDLDGKLTGLGSYSVEKIIFYAD